MRALYPWIVSILIVLLPSEANSQNIIASFEDQTDLEDIQLSEGVDILRSTDFPAVGSYSGNITFPEKGGELSLHNLNITDWSRKEALLCYIWTSELTEISLIIEDSADATCSAEYALKKGANHLQLALSDDE